MMPQGIPISETSHTGSSGRPLLVVYCNSNSEKHADSNDDTVQGYEKAKHRKAARNIMKIDIQIRECNIINAHITR